ncbi:MAG: hypothetical protein NC347_10870 [Clostridium sp.]|nr:hypothetical protein [Clostridium sp.]
MEKQFEDYFSEIQVDMVDICLEYIEDKADIVYIYCSNEDGMVSCDFFYKINGVLTKNHKVNEILSEPVDVSPEQQREVLKILIDDTLQIEELCKKYSRDVPTEIKIVYDAVNESLTADYRYDLVYSKHKSKLPNDIVDKWFKKLQKGKRFGK